MYKGVVRDEGNEVDAFEYGMVVLLLRIGLGCEIAGGTRVLVGIEIDAAEMVGIEVWVVLELDVVGKSVLGGDGY